MHVLHLEDSLSDFELIQDQLKSRWPDCTVTRVSAHKEYEEAVLRGGFDLILSDYTLPNYNGLAALAFAREHRPEMPFVYISGTIGEERAIEAIKAGASDYIIKDRPMRLISAIEAAFVQIEREAARRRAESRSNEQAKLLDKAREAICAIDAEGCITFWNAGAERHYGWNAEDVVGRELRRMLYSRDPAAFEAARSHVLLHGEWHGEMNPQTAAGDLPIMDSFWTLVTDDFGVACAILIVDADITEKKRIELQLMQNQRLEMLGLLTGGIAHDLNNVLGPIVTAVEMLQERPGSEADDELLNIVKGSADHGVDLVRQLLAFARGDSGELSELSIDALVGSVLKLLYHVIPPGVEIKASIGDGLWRVNGDATQLRQALINLCINARDALPEGGEIELSVENTPVMSNAKCAVGEARPGRYVCFTVRDNGTGIPPQVIGRLFDAFFSTKQSGKGTGLGLSNIARIVKAHAGFLTVESAMGIGSSFHIHLPAANGAGANEFPPSTRPLLRAREHLLLIEDNKALQTVFDVALSTRGFAVSATTTASDGLMLLRAQAGSISLAIVDLHLPIEECAAVVREMRAISAQLSVAVLCGASPEHQEALSFDPPVELLPKAVTSENLIGTVARILGEKVPKS
jgi:two-component system, cell cycle sensor histidine kinase and response regulator CckA